MKIFTVGAYPPNGRGSAQYGAELRSALLGIAPGWQVDVCAVDACREPVHRPSEPALTADRDDRFGYQRAAKSMHAMGADVVVVQFDRGVFGGPDGAHILDLTAELRDLELPYVVVMHTVPAQPRPDLRTMLSTLCGRAAAVTTFTAEARTLLQHASIAVDQPIAVLPHGAAWRLHRPFHPGLLRREVSGTLRRLRATRLLTTLGPSTPDSGLHTAVTALAKLAERHRSVALLIAGTSPAEPNCAAYRSQLRQLAIRIGVLDRIHVLDAHLTAPELTALLARTDVFLSPRADPHHDCSGPLGYALAAGRPVVSTATRYAIELFAARPDLSPGALVPCDDTDALATAIDELLSQPTTSARAAADAATLGRTISWDTVAVKFAGLLQRAAT